MFGESVRILLLSQGEDEAWDLLKKCKFILSHLPPFLQLSLEHQSLGSIEFKVNDSEIKALPSTTKAGRSTDATIVVRDELATHPYGKENFMSVSPTIDSGGQLIDLSTIDKLDANNHFTDRVNKARDKRSNAHFVFLGWRSRPTRIEGISLDDWFSQTIKPKYTKFEIEQEYPETVEQALAPSQVVCRFDTEILSAMLNDCRYPIIAERDGIVKIWKHPIAGRRYVFAIDTSEGSEDPAVGIVVDWQTCEEVAKFRGFISVDDQSYIIKDLWERYNKCFIAPERNADGRRLIDKLISMGVNNFFYTSKDKPGWWTDTKTRPVMLGELVEAVDKRNIVIYDSEEIGEFMSFIRTDKHPEGKAMGGRHDDSVITWAIALQLRKHLPIGAVSIKSFKYREG